MIEKIESLRVTVLCCPCVYDSRVNREKFWRVVKHGSRAQFIVDTHDALWGRTDSSR